MLNILSNNSKTLRKCTEIGLDYFVIAAHASYLYHVITVLFILLQNIPQAGNVFIVHDIIIRNEVSTVKSAAIKKNFSEIAGKLAMCAKQYIAHKLSCETHY